jgi:cbb3-type cytochrome oxidase maturation protein
MEVLLMMLLISFIIAACFLILFVLSIRQGEFDDLEGPSARIFSKETKEKQNP